MRGVNKSAKTRMIIFLVLAGILCIACIFIKCFEPNDPNVANLLMAKKAPCEQYPWGTDALGRCIMSRVFDGAFISVFSAVLIVGLSMIIGCIIGMISGYFGGRVDSIIMRITDMFLAFPGMVLALAIAGILGKGLTNAIIALVTTNWTQYARLSRSYVLSVREEDFIKAAKLDGHSSLAIMVKHVLPNTLRPIIVTASLNIGGALLSLAGLSFLGLGAQAPAAEWGSMLADNRGLMQIAPWMVLYPGIAIFLVSILFNLMGDSVRDVLDPFYSNNVFKKQSKKRRFAK